MATFFLIALVCWMLSLVEEWLGEAHALGSSELGVLALKGATIGALVTLTVADLSEQALTSMQLVFAAVVGGLFFSGLGRLLRVRFPRPLH